MAVFGNDRGFIGGIVDTVKDTVGKISDTISGGIETITVYVDNFFSNLNSELSRVKDYFGQSADSIKDAVNSAWRKSVDAVQKPDGIFDTAILKAQAMANIAMDKVEDLKTIDLVKALTNWTVGFVVGLIQGFFDTIKYGIEKGFSPLQGFFHASAAGAYELMKQIGYIPINAFNSFWSGLNNASGAFGPFAPIFIAVVIFFLFATVMWIGKVVPPWIVARIAERA